MELIDTFVMGILFAALFGINLYFAKETVRKYKKTKTYGKVSKGEFYIAILVNLLLLGSISIGSFYLVKAYYGISTGSPFSFSVFPSFNGLSFFLGLYWYYNKLIKKFSIIIEQKTNSAIDEIRRILEQTLSIEDKTREQTITNGNLFLKQQNTDAQDILEQANNTETNSVAEAENIRKTAQDILSTAREEAENINTRLEEEIQRLREVAQQEQAMCLKEAEEKAADLEGQATRILENAPAEAETLRKKAQATRSIALTSLKEAFKIAQTNTHKEIVTGIKQLLQELEDLKKSIEAEEGIVPEVLIQEINAMNTLLSQIIENGLVFELPPAPWQEEENDLPQGEEDR